MQNSLRTCLKIYRDTFESVTRKFGFPWNATNYTSSHCCNARVIHVKFIDPWTKCYKKKVSKPVSSFPLIRKKKKKKEKEKRNRNCLIQRIVYTVLFRNYFRDNDSWTRRSRNFSFLFFSFLFLFFFLLFKSSSFVPFFG